MKKVVGLIGGLVLVAAVALAGVKTDKLVFGDDTEMTTAGSGGSVSFPLDAEDSSITNLNTLEAEATGVTDGQYIIDLDAGQIGGEYMGGGFQKQIQLMSPDLTTQVGGLWDANSGNQLYGYDTSGNWKIYNNVGGVLIDCLNGKIYDPNNSASLAYDISLAQWTHNGTTLLDLAPSFGTGALYCWDGEHVMSWSGGGQRYLHDDYGDEAVGFGGNGEGTDLLVNPDGDNGRNLGLNMDNEAGTDCTFVQFMINGSPEADGSWRIGVINSNLVIQVYTNMTWNTALTVQRP